MPTYLGAASLMATLTPFLEGLAAADVPVDRAFWTVPSPGTLALFCEVSHRGAQILDEPHARFLAACFPHPLCCDESDV